MNIQFSSKSLLFLLIALLMSSCESTDTLTKSLKEAESCMEAYPDSALKILQEIPLDKLTGKKQADYALLMTQAIDKNYLPLESDSLIRIAMDYYDTTEDDISRGKAYFYYGRYLFEAKDYKKSLDMLLKSRSFLENTDQYKILGLLLEHIGNINIDKDWYDEALSNHKESLQYYILAEDTLSISYALRNVGRTYLFKNELDSVFYYCVTALELANDKNLKSESSILHELSVISRFTGDYEKAEYYILKSIDKTELDNKYTRYLSLGKLYLQIGKYDEAEKAIMRSLESSKLETVIATYDELAKLEKKRNNYSKALEFIEKRDSINDFYDEKEMKVKFMELQKKYRNERLKNENLEMKNIINLIVFWSVILFLIILMIAAYFYYRYYNNKRRIEDIEHTISINEEEISNYKTELLKYNDVQAEHQNVIGELTGKITLLTTQNRDLLERLVALGHEKPASSGVEVNSYVVALRTLVLIKSGALKRKMSKTDVAMQIKLFNFLYDGYAERLMKEFPDLTKHDIEICCLLKIKCTNEELSQVFNTAPNSVRKAKTRLKKRLGIAENESLETFLAKY